MVLPILVLPATQWFGVNSPEPLARKRPFELYNRRRRREDGPRWQPMSRQRHRAALLKHWTPAAARCAPPPLPHPALTSRSGAGGRHLLAQGEALLRKLLRRRRDRLGLSRHDLVQVATGFDGHTLRAPAGPAAAVGFVLVSMYWEGCRHPLSLFARPLHPPTGLVRWLTGFTVQEQVDHGRVLLTQLAQEEQRMFEFAMHLIGRIDAMTVNHGRGLVLLPELLRMAELPNVSQNDIFTTSSHEESRTYVACEGAPKASST